MEIVVGGNKRARRSYGFDEVALVPGPLVVDPRDVDVSWELGGRRFEIPILASALDAAVNPALAVAMSKLGGLAVLNLDGVQARYEDAEAVLARIAEAPQDGVIGLIQKLYEEPVKPELVARRVREIKEGGGVAAVAAAQSAVAVICGTPMPSTLRDVQMCPGPTPTRIPAAPASISSRVAW